MPNTKPDTIKKKRALLSVYDKTGIVEFAQGLIGLGFDIVSSGGTSATLTSHSIEHVSVEEITGSPEMLGGRVKTLHPKIHGGILADTTKTSHVQDLVANQIEPIDMVACNLYPFETEPGIEMIDVGGPTMVRAGAKNFDRVTTVVDPEDYSVVLDEIVQHGLVRSETRRRLALKAFRHTADYDQAIARWLEGQLDPSLEDGSTRVGSSAKLEKTIRIDLERANSLRYGENPHLDGARYRQIGTTSWWDSVVQHGGLELSYLNYLDTEAAWNLVFDLGDLLDMPVSNNQVAVIVKHANACGVAVGRTPEETYENAFLCDPVSAFGGIVAVGFEVTDSVAQTMASKAQADVIIAPSFSERAIEILRAKRKNTRILSALEPDRVQVSVRQLGHSFLVQQADKVEDREVYETLACGQAPDADKLIDLKIAWMVCARTSSNAIVIANHGQAIGIGAGQQNRVDCARIALTKAGDRAKGAVAASDAFIPFRDTVDELGSGGIDCVIQPGGSVRDDEVISAAQELGMTMLLTGTRHFKH